MKLRGYLYAAVAAAAYGTNPAFALPLYEQGMNPNSVLLFRYALGIPLLVALLLARGHSLRLPAGSFWHVAILGIFCSVSSLTLFESYNYMNSGIASTLLFVYPVLVAVLMIFFFYERVRATLVVCLLLMCVGMAMLTRTSSGATLSPYGCALVMLSALTYALYIIMVNVSKRVREIPTTKLLLYVLAWGCVVYLCMIPAGTPLTLPARSSGWLNLAALAVIPTVLSLALTTRAIQLIGSTSTAIFGALEPVTAVIISVTLLGQPLTVREVWGGVLIALATTLVVAGTHVENALLHVRKMFPRRVR